MIRCINISLQMGQWHKRMQFYNKKKKYTVLCYVSHYYKGYKGQVLAVFWDSVVFYTIWPLNMLSVVLILSNIIVFSPLMFHWPCLIVLCMLTGLSGRESLRGIYLPLHTQGQGLLTDMISLVHATEHTLLDMFLWSQTPFESSLS